MNLTRHELNSTVKISIHFLKSEVQILTSTFIIRVYKLLDDEFEEKKLEGLELSIWCPTHLSLTPTSTPNDYLVTTLINGCNESYGI